LFTVQKALPLLNDGASVVLNASTAADHGTEAFGVYGASKAAVRAFARTWANELIGRGIRVNAVSPWPVDTPGIDHAFGEDAPEVRRKLAAGIAIGRLAGPEEAAAVVAFLAASESSFVVGANFYVDGGENQI
jgi:NAD(P)-dependent dehydrogenase (short-subunit alcohol dehydrogenase family)